jgi:pyruvate dehydrogenase E1 component
VELENKEWLESLEDVFHSQGSERVRDLLSRLHEQARKYGVLIRQTGATQYVNTIPGDQQPPYPGRREIEHRIKNVIRWNAMAIVVRANREESGIAAGPKAL